MVVKKNRIEKREDIPVLSSAIDPEQLSLNFDPVPRLLFEGGSATAKEYYEKDMLRLKESLKVGRIEPKFAMVSSDLHGQLKNRIDLRTGNADIAVLLPKNVRIPSPSVSDDLQIPDVPINQKTKML